MAKITSIRAREILDSRGNPTVEAELITTNSQALAAVPSGASTGVHEAVELRDGGKRYGGKGVLKAVANVNKILGKKLKGLDAAKQTDLDQAMLEIDGTSNKSRLGANAILAVSLAAAKASAVSYDMSLYEYFGKLAGNPQAGSGKGNWLLPTPMMNILNGGKHADNGIDIQEFMIVPTNFPSFAEALQAGAEIFHNLKKILKKSGSSTNVGDEGGFAPNFSRSEEALDAIMEAIKVSDYSGKVKIALDPASSEFFVSGKYKIEGQELDSAAMVEYYAKLADKYPIVLIEDGLSEDDWAGWKLLTKKLGKRLQLVGDDIFVTNPKRIKKGITEKVANSVLIKVNQIGTLTETIEAVKLAHANNYTVVISHRSGETEDTTIADLAVGLGAGQIKTGSLCRTDRVCKYNQLLRIEERLGERAEYAGNVFKS